MTRSSVVNDIYLGRMRSACAELPARLRVAPLLLPGNFTGINPEEQSRAWTPAVLAVNEVAGSFDGRICDLIQVGTQSLVFVT